MSLLDRIGRLPGKLSLPLYGFIAIVALIWTVAVLVNLHWSMDHNKQGLLEMAPYDDVTAANLQTLLLGHGGLWLLGMIDVVSRMVVMANTGALGGTVFFDTEEMGGATFIVRLPAAVPVAALSRFPCLFHTPEK